MSEKDIIQNENEEMDFEINYDDEIEEQRSALKEKLNLWGSGLANGLIALAIGIRDFVSGFFRNLIFGDKERLSIANSVSRALDARNIGKTQPEKESKKYEKSEPQKDIKAKTSEKDQDLSDKKVQTAVENAWFPKEGEERMDCQVHPSQIPAITEEQLASFLQNPDVKTAFQKLDLEVRQDGTNLIVASSQNLANMGTLHGNLLLHGDATELSSALLRFEQLQGNIPGKAEYLERMHTIDVRAMAAVAQMTFSHQNGRINLGLEQSEAQELAYIYSRSERGLEPSMIQIKSDGEIEVSGAYNGTVNFQPEGKEYILSILKNEDFQDRLSQTYEHTTKTAEVQFGHGVSLLYESTSDQSYDKIFVKTPERMYSLEQFQKDPGQCLNGEYGAFGAPTEKERAAICESVDLLSDMSLFRTHPDVTIDYDPQFQGIRFQRQGELIAHAFPLKETNEYQNFANRVETMLQKNENGKYEFSMEKDPQEYETQEQPYEEMPSMDEYEESIPNEEIPKSDNDLYVDL